MKRKEKQEQFKNKRLCKQLSIHSFLNSVYRHFKDGKFKTVTDKDVKGKWGIFFFYPADFTFVCPTELVDMAEKYEPIPGDGGGDLFCKHGLAFCTQSMARCF